MVILRQRATDAVSRHLAEREPHFYQALQLINLIVKPRCHFHSPFAESALSESARAPVSVSHFGG